MKDLIRIPRTFFIDHVERDLPTPLAVRETSSHFYIRRDDPNLPELVSDAEHYVDGVDAAGSLPRAARALLLAIRQGVNP